VIRGELEDSQSAISAPKTIQAASEKNRRFEKKEFEVSGGLQIRSKSAEGNGIAAK